jgi:hypothetical protein
MTAKRLVLDRAHLIAMVSRDDFYAACPGLAWLRDNGLARGEEYRASEAASCCGGNWQIIKPIVNGLFNWLKTAAPEEREQVRAYLEGKKGYAIRPLVLFYRSERTGKALKFEF